MSDESRRPFALSIIAAVYLFSLLLAASNFGQPFPLMGTLHSGKAGEVLVFADSMISLYLVIGILKRQRLTVWLLIAYNVADICNAFVNLVLVSADEYARLAGGPITGDEVRTSTIAASVFLTLVTAYILRNRRHFNNPSPYLF